MSNVLKCLLLQALTLNNKQLGDYLVLLRCSIKKGKITTINELH